MEKYLFYGMTGDKMCFNHILLNALDLVADGHKASIIFEGASVKLVPLFEKEENKLYLKAKQSGLIAGICYACSAAMGVLEDNKNYGLPLLDDMSGHAGMKKFIYDGYKVVSL